MESKKVIKGVITYIIKGDNVLLIYKKRGHGRGWYNGPGGKIEKGETPRSAAVRETYEEVGVIPIELELAGIIRFYSVNDTEDWVVYIFRARDYIGSFRETSEARPEWFKISKIPYHLMWEDDRYWLPIVMRGEFFKASIWFANNRVVKVSVKKITQEELDKIYQKIS